MMPDPWVSDYVKGQAFAVPPGVGSNGRTFSAVCHSTLRLSKGCEELQFRIVCNYSDLKRLKQLIYIQ